MLNINVIWAILSAFRADDMLVRVVAAADRHGRERRRLS